MYRANVIADSLSPEGVRLTTLEVEYPHAVHKDMMTHRMLSRNFQSFRAFPPEQVIEKIQKDPFIPVFTKRMKGMANGEPLGGEEKVVANRVWWNHINSACDRAWQLIDRDAGKDQVNFLLQDLTWITGIVSATDWDNFFALRLAINPETGKPFARPEVYKTALLMKQAIDASTPKPLDYGEWHTPLIREEDWQDTLVLSVKRRAWDYIKQVSTGRCARTSYLTHHGIRDTSADIGLHDSLKGDGHMSPFEHIARPFSPDEWETTWEIKAEISKTLQLPRHIRDEMIRQADYRGNFRRWHQYRKDIPNEDNYGRATEVLYTDA